MDIEIIKEINDHKKNSEYIGYIYYSLTIIGLIFTSIVTLLIGGKSINEANDPVNIAAFIINLISSIVLSSINILKLETKINQHHTSKREYEDLLIDYQEGKNIIEQLKIIRDHAPNICFK